MANPLTSVSRCFFSEKVEVFQQKKDHWGEPSVIRILQFDFPNLCRVFFCVIWIHFFAPKKGSPCEREGFEDGMEVTLCFVQRPCPGWGDATAGLNCFSSGQRSWRLGGLKSFPPPKKQGIIKWDPSWGGWNKLEIYGKFEGFPRQNSAVFGLVIQWPLKKKGPQKNRKGVWI